MKKRITLIFVFILIFVSFIFNSCQTVDKNKASKTDDNDIIDLSWYINFSWFNNEWGNDSVSKAITKKLGVNINFVVPTGDPQDKLNSMMDSDSLPDLITLGWWEGQISSMIEQEKVYALDELADQYDTYFWKVTNDQSVQWYTSEDGHLYQYPNSSFSPDDYATYNRLASNETFLVRKDIYEAIGSPDMTTPEGFIAAVEKAATMFPTANANNDPLIPIGCHEFSDTGCDSFDGFLFDFLAVPYMENGRAIDRLTNPDYISWLKAFRKLGSEGYLKDEIFIDTRKQMEEKIAKGQYFCMIYQRTDLVDAEMSLYRDNPDSIYIAVDGPKNMAGDDYRLPGTSINGWTVTLVSKNCTHPEKAIELITYLISEEGQIMTWLGVEGETWDYDKNGVPRLKPEYEDMFNNNPTEFKEKFGADSCYWMFQNDAIATKWLRDDENSPLTQLKQWTYPYTTYVGQYTITFDSSNEVYDIKHNADKQWGDTLPKLLLSSSEKEFDSIYNNFIKERYEIYNYDKVLDALTEEMNKNIEKLGIENEQN
ncbi:MAG: extracellular solute-binding protein [Lachnospiraceae bacterium]|nr:extracellular solute-binding protein [Lachnospiraceae bacterium]